MVINQCNKCNKEFQYPWMLRRHIERKYKCIVDQDEPDEVQFGPEKTQFGPEKTQFGPYSTKMLQNGPEKTQFGPEKTQFGPKKTQFGPKKTQFGPKNSEKTQFGPMSSGKVTDGADFCSDETQENTCIYCMKYFPRGHDCRRHTIHRICLYVPIYVFT